jgi:serine/threonine protein phosphatase PrpC
MARHLVVSIGQASDRGRKPGNQDFHGALVPDPPLIDTKGIVVAIADGISSSTVAHIASESAVKALLTDYYCTSEAWSVKTSAQRVIAATNSWLHAQTRRSQYSHDMDQGYVCTLSVLVLKSATAHVFHIGDSRVHRLAGQVFEQLTEDHRVVISSVQTYLGRAMGARQDVDIDYHAEPVAAGDVFLLSTDGVHDHVEPRALAGILHGAAGNLEAAAQGMVAQALANGSPDNLTVQLVRVDAVPGGDAGEAIARAEGLPLPPLLEPRMVFDGYRILRQLHASSRSHIYLASDLDDDSLVALKIPSIDLRDDAAYLRRFRLEEWVARRIDSAHVLKPRIGRRPQNYLYVVTEYVEGQTLAQWMRDNPRPALEQVRGIVEQIARGLGAFHRREMLHQDIRPENIMVDQAGTVKIIDFGSTRVAGIAEADGAPEATELLGTLQYSAPEYFLGEAGTTQSDLFSVGVIAYQMLTGELPYGTGVSQARTRAQQRRLRYRPATHEQRDTPAWVDGALARAVSIDPAQRYAELSEFVHDLRHPNPELTARARPLLERRPLLFWQVLSLALALVVAVLGYRLARLG